MVEKAPAAQKTKKGESGRDPYALFKQAILAPQDEEKLLEVPPFREGEARKEDARKAMAQVCARTHTAEHTERCHPHRARCPPCHSITKRWRISHGS